MNESQEGLAMNE